MPAAATAFSSSVRSPRVFPADAMIRPSEVTIADLGHTQTYLDTDRNEPRRSKITRSHHRYPNQPRCRLTPPNGLTIGIQAGLVLGIFVFSYRGLNDLVQAGVQGNGYFDVAIFQGLSPKRDAHFLRASLHALSPAVSPHQAQQKG